MNDDPIERALREPGPRERGYLPAALPATLDAPTEHHRRSPLLVVGQMAAVAAVVAAGALLAVIIVRPSQPSPGAGAGSPTPTTPPPSSSPAALVDCHAADLAWTIDAWTGAAGSRETTVVAHGVSSLSGCEIRGRVLLELRDANGALLSGQPSASSIAVRSGTTIEMAVRWSNWCGRSVVAPVSLAATLPRDSKPVLLTPANGQVLLPPPCNGPGQPSTLDARPFGPSSRALQG